MIRCVIGHGKVSKCKAVPYASRVTINLTVIENLHDRKASLSCTKQKTVGFFVFTPKNVGKNISGDHRVARSQ